MKKTNGNLYVVILFVTFILLSSSLLHAGVIPNDRCINWNPGIEGGVPHRTTVFCDVTQAPYNALGNDTMDVTQAIQDAIDACPVGQVVYIPEGVYRLTGGIAIDKGIVLRGAGPDKTKLKFYRSGNSYPPNIRMSGDGTYGQSKINVQSRYTKGTTNLVLDSADSLSAGDLIYITQTNDGEFVDNSGTGGDCTWCGVNNGENAMGQLLYINNVNGNTISFEPELYWTYTAGLNPYVKKVANPLKNAGLEDLYVDNVNETVLISIHLYSTVNCWIKNIESNKGQRHIELDLSYRSVVRDSYIHHHHEYVPNHYCVLLGTFATANLIENNLFYYTKGGTMMCAWGAAGNVFGYNFCRVSLYPRTYGIQSNITHHGAHPMMNLWEGNIGQKVGSDNYWGSISHNTLFRNYVTREENPEALNYTRFCVVLEARCRYFNIVGNILGYEGMPGIYEAENIEVSFDATAAVYKLGYNSDGDASPEDNDPLVKSTLLRHGNYDYFNNDIVWDATISNHDLADSYYLNEKPEFFGQLAWPPIGPDVPGYTGKISAQIRFENIPQTPTGTISGTVTDSIGNPIQGAMVSDGTRSDTTDAGGNYTLTDVPVDTFTITASISGYIPFSIDSVVVTEHDTTIVDFELIKEPSGTISGTVTDSITGYPIKGATVRVGIRYETTDAGGNYTLTDIAVDTFTITASASGYFFLSFDGVIVTDGNTTIADFQLTELPDLVGFWAFEESSGTTAYDSSENKNDGIIHGPTSTAGKLDLAFQFDGTDDYITIPTSASLDGITDEITLIAWIRLSAGSRHSIVGRWLYGDVEERSFELDVKQGKVWFGLSGDGTNNDTQFLLSSLAVASGTWTHVAATSDGSTMKIYINGVLDPDTKTSPSAIHPSSADVHIGRWEFASNEWYYPFHGTMDEVKIYNRALSAQEIEDDYSIAEPTGNLVYSPLEYELFEAYPSPFHSSTTISYKTAIAGKVTISIYDISGRKIRTLVSETQQADHYSVVWDGTNATGGSVGSGVYFYTLDIDNSPVATKKLVLLQKN